MSSMDGTPVPTPFNSPWPVKMTRFGARFSAYKKILYTVGHAPLSPLWLLLWLKVWQMQVDHRQDATTDL